MKLDKYEKDILKSVEEGEWQSKGDIKSRSKELQTTVKKQNKQAISIRLDQNDIYELKKRALETSIPYQNIIGLLVHKFVSNEIEIKL